MISSFTKPRKLDHEFLSYSMFKHIAFYTLSTLSLGSVYLIFYWFPHLFKHLYNPANLETASHVLLIDPSRKSSEIVEVHQQKIQISPVTNKEYHTFLYYKHHLYIYQDSEFFQYNDLIYEDVKQSPANLQKYMSGISNNLATRLEQTLKRNVIEVPLIPLVTLFFSEIFTPFTVFQIFSFLVWFNNDYAGYATVILVLTAVSICLTVYETRNQNKRIRDMSFYDQPVQVRRTHKNSISSEILKVSSCDLQIGDLVLISPSEQVPADLLLLEGKCIVDESMITGESTPCLKQAFSGVSEVSGINVLSSGTFCVVSEGVSRNTN